MDLRDRVALISGGTGGLGAVIARMLADQGAHVALTYFGHRDEGVEVCHEIETRGRKNLLVHLDQTDPASCAAAVRATVDAVGLLDILVNNAAVNQPVPFQDLDALTPKIGSGWKNWSRRSDLNR
jgi:NAD(P)-dependent dehydrogenase (short-subunit alcohol dehydrogenase family)